MQRQLQCYGSLVVLWTSTRTSSSLLAPRDEEQVNFAELQFLRSEQGRLIGQKAGCFANNRDGEGKWTASSRQLKYSAANVTQRRLERVVSVAHEHMPI